MPPDPTSPTTGVTDDGRPSLARRIATVALLLVGAGCLLLLPDPPVPMTPLRWIGLVAIVALGLVPAVHRPVARVLDGLRRPSRERRRWIAVGVAIAAGTYTLVTAQLQDRDLFPKSHDEQSYVLQMRMLASGRLWLDAHPAGAFFDTFHVVVEPVYASVYFPGTALMYVPAAWLGLPMWVLPLLAASAAAGLLYRVTADLTDGLGGLLAALVLVSSNWYRMLALLVMAQMPALLLGLVMVWAWLRWRRSAGRARWGWLVLIGASAGWMAITRPVDALAYAIPVGVGVMWFSGLPRHAMPGLLGERGERGGRGGRGGPGLGSGKIVVDPTREEDGPGVHSARDANETSSDGDASPVRRSFVVRIVVSLALIVLGAAPFLGMQVVQNRGITGSFTTTPFDHYAERDQPQISYGFHDFDRAVRPVSQLPQKQALYDRFIAPRVEAHRPGNLIGQWTTTNLAFTVDSTLPARPLLLLVPLGLLCLNSARRIVVASTLPLFLLLYVPYTFFLEHYVIVVAPAMLLLMVLGIEALVAAWPRWRSAITTAVTFGVVFACVVYLPELNGRVTDESFRSPMMRYLRTQLPAEVPGSAVVMVRWAEGENFHQEPVFNIEAGHPDDNRIVWAHDLAWFEPVGSPAWLERNRPLFEYYAEHQPERAIYLFDRGALSRLAEDPSSVSESDVFRRLGTPAGLVRQGL